MEIKLRQNDTNAGGIAIISPDHLSAIQMADGHSPRWRHKTWNNVTASMWQQNYTPLFNSVGASAAASALPVVTLLILLGILRKPAWVAALAGLATAVFVAFAVYGMPASLVVAAVTYGAAFGLFPIGWVVFWAVVLYRVTVETGKFEIVKDSVGSLTQDRRLQALLIAFAFGAFIEGAAGFGTPVAVAAAMLAGLGFSPFYAAGICLLANTAPVAFGSIGTPLLTLAGITGLPLLDLSANVGRICAPLSFMVPAYLILVMGGMRALSGVWPAALLCGASFAGTQFFVSNYMGPQLTDILSSLAAIASLVILFKVWAPKDSFVFDERGQTAAATASGGSRSSVQTSKVAVRHHPAGEVFIAWVPYGLLVVFVLLLQYPPITKALSQWNTAFGWPGAAQRHRACCSGGQNARTLRRHVCTQSAYGLWNSVYGGCVPLGADSQDERRPILQNRSRNSATACVFDPDDCIRAWRSRS